MTDADRYDIGVVGGGSMNLTALATQIRRVRQARGLTYRQLADLCKGDVNASTIHRLEHGKPVNSDTLLTVLSALHLSWVPSCVHEYTCRFCGEPIS